MILSKQKTVFALSLFVCMNIHAKTNNETDNSSNQITELSAIEVKALAEPAGGGDLIDNKKITSVPTPTNSVTDVLRTNSNIQFSADSRSSVQGGEIAPPRISIRGAQHYENNFMINGISNNNNLNPSGFDVSDWDSASGEAQSLFIDTSLVESVTAYTEAISAEYGSFTGGVIDAKLKDASSDRWHFMAKYRYTKDDWAEYHLTDEQRGIDKSTSKDFQPEFNKYEYAITADGPIGDHLGLMLSYGEQHSKIPLWSGYDINSSATTTYKERRTQYRDNKNYLIKLNTHDIDSLEASLTMIYAPYTGAKFFYESKNSDFDQKGGGLNIAYDMKNELSFGTLKNTLAFKQDKFSMDGDTNYYYAWRNTLGQVNWGKDGWGSREGYTGDQKFLENALIYKGVIDFDEIEAGLLTHLIKTGVEAEFGRAQFKRDEAYYFCHWLTGLDPLDPSVTGSKENGIIAGEQWTDTLYLYEAIDNKKSYTTAALFLEDSIKFDRYTIRPGVRLSTDTVTDNTDIAPRFFANADIFDDTTFNVYGGYNRYYGGLLLYNAIYQYHASVYSRNAPSAPWVENVILGWGGDSDYSLDGIKTPYSDEFSIGASLDSRYANFKFGFVNRKYKDQLKQVREDLGNNVFKYKNTNEGESSYWGVTLEASKEYKFGDSRHFSGFSVTNSKTTTNMNGLSFSSADEFSPTHITYDGKLTGYEDVPSPNYNSPWVVTYTHIMELNDYLRLGLNARYERGVDGYKYVDDLGQNDPSGRKTRNYESKHYGDIFTVDLAADYDWKFKGNKLTFGVEILNLFNRKNDTSYATSSSNIDSYAMGRQFYANVKYEY
jgi:hypothetical protein